MVAEIRGARQRATGIESIDINAYRNVPLNLRGNLLERHEPSATHNPSLKDADSWFA